MTVLLASQSEIAQFYSAIFLYADENSYISLRAFDQNDRGQPPLLIEGVLIDHDPAVVINRAHAAAQRSANADRPIVFAPPVATFKTADRARAEDLANGVAISVEIDAGDPAVARRTLEHLLGPATVAVLSGGDWSDPYTGEVHPKTHLHWRLSEPTRTPEDHARLRDARWLAAILVGADTTAAPPAHPLRWPGSWNLKGAPRMARLATGNPASEVHLGDALERLQDAVEAAGLGHGPAVPKQATDPQAALGVVRSAMTALPNVDLHWEEWNRVGMACWRATGGSPEGLTIWADWSAKSKKHEEVVCAGRWAHYATSPPTRIGAGTLFHLAGMAGWQRPGARQEEPPPAQDDPGYWNSVEIDAQRAAEPPETAEPTAASPEPHHAAIFDPWNALRPVAFPGEAVPPVLREMIEDRARIIGADPCAIAWTCISACSAAIDGRVRLQMKRHDQWSVPPAIWVALIGAPSTKKSPIMDAAWTPLHHVQALDLARHQRLMAEWSSLPKAQRATVPEPMPARRLVSHDATMEALQEILSKQDRGIGVLRDELAGWIGSMEKYAPGKGGAADRAFALQSYNGVAHVVDRIGRGTLPIGNLLTTMCGGIQPDRLRQFGDLTDDGLWQRFVPVIVAPAGIGTDEAPSAHIGAYKEMIDRLLLIPSLVKLHLDEDAHRIREEVQRRIFHLEQSEVLGARFVGFCGKLVGLWGRLALVLHCIVDRDTNLVSGRTAAAAKTLLFKSVLPNAARVYTAMGGAGGDIEATQSIAGYVLTKALRRIVVSDLTSNVRVCRHRSVEDVRKLLSPLQAGGWIAPEKDYNPTSWVVNDLVHLRFADRAAREARRREQVRALITANLGDDSEG